MYVPEAARFVWMCVQLKQQRSQNITQEKQINLRAGTSTLRHQLFNLTQQKLK